MTSYSEKLRDPRWQKLRLKILERDRWTCLSCGSQDKTLHVHHAFYEHDDPWDADPDSLYTLCFECHEEEPGFYKARVNSMLLLLARSIGIRTAQDLLCLLNGVYSYAHKDFLSSKLAKDVSSPWPTKTDHLVQALKKYPSVEKRFEWLADMVEERAAAKKKPENAEPVGQATP